MKLAVVGSRGIDALNLAISGLMFLMTLAPESAMEIPQKHHGKAIHVCYVFAIPIAMVYISFQVYTLARFLVFAMLHEVCATIFSVQNIKISNDRRGPARSAILLIMFIVGHAVGNFHVFTGPDVFHVYGFFHVRSRGTGFCLPANVPGGELTILTFGVKDVTEELNVIHPLDVIIGMIGGDGWCGGSAVATLGGGGGGGIPMEVAKPSCKTDHGAVVVGEVLDFTSFLSEHPGGELAAILTFAGKDATEEFNLIHPPNIIGKDASDAVIGKVGSGVAAAAGTAPKAGLGGPARKDKGSTPGNHQAWGHPRFNRQVNINDNPGVPLVSLKAYLRDTRFLVLAMLCEVFATTTSSGTNVKISIDRPGPTRNAILPILAIVIHVVGNFGDFKGPGDFSGYDFLYVRPYWTGFCLPANIVEENTFLSVPPHNFVSLRRPGDMKLALVGSEDISVLNWTISGLMFLTFMAIHLFHLLQFCSGDADQFGPYYVKPTPYLVNLWGISSLNLFRTNEDGMERVGVGKTFHRGYVFAVFIAMVCASLPVYMHFFVVPLCPPPYLLNLEIPIRLNLVRGIHRMELEALQIPDWCLYYLAAVIICSTHMRLGTTTRPSATSSSPWSAPAFWSTLTYLLNLDNQIRLNLFGMITPGCAKVEVRDIYRMEFEIFQFSDWRLYYLAAVPICSTRMCLGWQNMVPTPAVEIPMKQYVMAILIGHVFAIFNAMVGLHPPLRRVPVPTVLHQADALLTNFQVRTAAVAATSLT